VEARTKHGQRNAGRTTGYGAHYAVHRDVLALKLAGGWSSVSLVERYAHLSPLVRRTTSCGCRAWAVHSLQM
jgi:hypothetical protein